MFRSQFLTTRRAALTAFRYFSRSGPKVLRLRMNGNFKESNEPRIWIQRLRKRVTMWSQSIVGPYILWFLGEFPEVRVKCGHDGIKRTLYLDSETPKTKEYHGLVRRTDNFFFVRPCYQRV